MPFGRSIARQTFETVATFLEFWVARHVSEGRFICYLDSFLLGTRESILWAIYKCYMWFIKDTLSPSHHSRYEGIWTLGTIFQKKKKKKLWYFRFSWPVLDVKWGLTALHHSCKGFELGFGAYFVGNEIRPVVQWIIFPSLEHLLLFIFDIYIKKKKKQ